VAAGAVAAVNPDKVAPVQNYFHSLFSSVQLFLNDKLVSASDSNYPYRAYLGNLLGSSSDHVKSFKGSEMFFMEDGGRQALNDPFGAQVTTVFAIRKAYEKLIESGEQGKVFLMGRIQTDMFLQPRLLINGVTMRLRL